MKIQVKARVMLEDSSPMFDNQWFTLKVKYKIKGQLFYSSIEKIIYSYEEDGIVSYIDFVNRITDFLNDYENNMRNRCTEMINKRLKTISEHKIEIDKDKALKDLINKKGDFKFEIEIK